jgi:hypothetical protein
MKPFAEFRVELLGAVRRSAALGASPQTLAPSPWKIRNKRNIRNMMDFFNVFRPPIHNIIRNEPNIRNNIQLISFNCCACCGCCASGGQWREISFPGVNEVLATVSSRSRVTDTNDARFDSILAQSGGKPTLIERPTFQVIPG